MRHWHTVVMGLGLVLSPASLHFGQPPSSEWPWLDAEPAPVVTGESAPRPPNSPPHDYGAKAVQAVESEFPSSRQAEGRPAAVASRPESLTGSGAGVSGIGTETRGQPVAPPFPVSAFQLPEAEMSAAGGPSVLADAPGPSGASGMAAGLGSPPTMPSGPRMGVDVPTIPSDTPADQVKTVPSNKPTANVTVQIQSDFVWFNQDEENILAVGEIPDGAFFRRARLGVFGGLYETVEYRAEFDFAGQARPRFLDNWIALTDIPYINNVIVGHFFEPFSLERYTPNRFITFMERSLADTFAPARNMGLMTYGHALNSRLTWAAGVFRSTSDDYGDDVSFQPGWAFTAHGTTLPWFYEKDQYTRYLLHLGASYSYRQSGDDPVRFAARPSVRLSQQGVGGVPIFVDTGPIDASSYQLVGLESAFVHGPLSIQGEWIAAPVRGDFGDNYTFHGGYAYASWFLTGESRSYSPTSILGRFREGIFQRVVPRTAVLCEDGRYAPAGLGAWEVAARWGYVNLNDGPVRGGFLHDVTLGVNWYLNAHTKVQLNWVRAFLDNDLSDGGISDSIALRFQWEH